MNFKSKQNQAYSIIALSISKDIQIFITCTDDPKKAWDILENQFSFVSITQLVRVYRKFYASSMVEGGSIMEHVTKMTQLAQDLRERNGERYYKPRIRCCHPWESTQFL